MFHDYMLGAPNEPVKPAERILLDNVRMTLRDRFLDLKNDPGFKLEFNS